MILIQIILRLAALVTVLALLQKVLTYGLPLWLACCVGFLMGQGMGRLSVKAEEYIKSHILG